MTFHPSSCFPFLIKSWRERISKREIACVLACPDLDLHKVDNIVKILNHLLRLTSINSMHLGVMKFCLQNIELSPGFRLAQIAVMRDKVGAIQAERPVVRANTKSGAAIPQNGWPNHTPLFKDLAQCNIHLLERSRLRHRQ